MKGVLAKSAVSSSKEDLAWYGHLRPDCTSMWGGIGVPSSVPNFYIPFGAAQDKYGHIYKFHDENDPFFSTTTCHQDLQKIICFRLKKLKQAGAF